MAKNTSTTIIWQKTISIVALASMLVTTTSIISGATNAFAADNNNNSSHGFDIKDFKIKSFRIQNNNPFLKVEGTAGGTKPSSHNTIYGYVFKTDKGIFASIDLLHKASKIFCCCSTISLTLV